MFNPGDKVKVHDSLLNDPFFERANVGIEGLYGRVKSTAHINKRIAVLIEFDDGTSFWLRTNSFTLLTAPCECCGDCSLWSTFKDKKSKIKTREQLTKLCKKRNCPIAGCDISLPKGQETI